MLTISIVESITREEDLWTVEGVNKAVINCGLDDDEAKELNALYEDYLRAKKDCGNLLKLNAKKADSYQEQLKSTISVLDNKAKKLLGNYAH